MVILASAHFCSWDFPKGEIHPGEDQWTAALRELQEETGIMWLVRQPWHRQFAELTHMAKARSPAIIWPKSMIKKLVFCQTLRLESSSTMSLGGSNMIRQENFLGAPTTNNS